MLVYLSPQPSASLSSSTPFRTTASLSASLASLNDAEVIDSLKQPKTLSSSSKLSLLQLLKQLQRLRPHFAAGGCFSFVSSMKFCTIFAKQSELGSNFDPPLSLLDEYSLATMSFSGEEFLTPLGDCQSKTNSLPSCDFNTSFAQSFRTTASPSLRKSISTSCLHSLETRGTRIWGGRGERRQRLRVVHCQALTIRGSGF